MKELQLIGLTFNFLGSLLFLLLSDPVMVQQEIQKNINSKDKVLKSYKIKKYFALFVILLGFLLQVISIF